MSRLPILRFLNLAAGSLAIPLVLAAGIYGAVAITRDAPFLTTAPKAERTPGLVRPDDGIVDDWYDLAPDSGDERRDYRSQHLASIGVSPDARWGYAATAADADPRGITLYQMTGGAWSIVGSIQKERFVRSCSLALPKAIAAALPRRHRCSKAYKPRP